MPLISPIYASLLGLLIIALGYYVTTVRHSEKVGLGYGNSDKMQQAVRVHANTVENAVLGMVLLLMLELQGAKGYWLHGTGAVLLGARLLYVKGLLGSKGVSFGRYWGTALSWASITTMAVVNLALAFSLL